LADSEKVLALLTLGWSSSESACDCSPESPLQGLFFVRVSTSEVFTAIVLPEPGFKDEVGERLKYCVF